LENEPLNTTPETNAFGVRPHTDEPNGRWSVRRLFATTRYFIVLAIICTFIGATILLISGALITFHTVVDSIKNPPDDPSEVKHLLLASIEVVDVFLVGMVMYVICTGLYTLFIDRDLPLPNWLVAHDLDDLKSRLVGVIATALGVLFLGEVVAWDGSRNILAAGVGIAAMVVALTYFMTNHAGNGN
jgi:uncharacterized membrane protein YqhA